MEKGNLAAGVSSSLVAIFMLPPEFYGASSGSDFRHPLVGDVVYP